VKALSITRPVRHFRRYQHILTIFARHGFGFALSLVPTDPWLLRHLSRALKSETMPEAVSLPAHFRQAFTELGPSFVKLGQLLSTRPDLLPPDYVTELSKLQDRVAPFAWEAARRVIQEDLGALPEKYFKHIDPKPLAAASLGQVHAATLYNGERVVVKVQRPDIRPTLEVDLEILNDLAHYAQQHTFLGQFYRLEKIAQDFADTLHNELDYRREARNADRLRANFAHEPYVYIPRVYWELTTERILVLEFIEGIKIDDIAALDAAGCDRLHLATVAARLTIKQVFDDGFFHADPHPGNFFVMEGDVIGAMDFGMVGYLSPEDRRDLVRLYAVAVRNDPAGVVDEFIHIGAARPDVDRRALERDVGRLLRKYYGLPLKEIRAADVLNDVMPVVYRHRLQMPSNFWLLAKTLSMMEGLGQQLAPGFDIFAFSQSYVARLLFKSTLPNRRWLEGALRTGQLWGDVSRELPRATLLLLDRMEKKEPIPLSLDQRSFNQLGYLVTRLSLSLVIAGMIIGLAIVIPTTSQSSLLFQIIAIAGFVFSLILGAWLLLSIVRKK